jgi:hypothetical protein
VIAQDLIWVIFEDMDPVWLRPMWEDGEFTCADMMDTMISLALLRLSLGFDLLTFCEQCCCILFWRCIYFLVDGLLTSTFDDYLLYYECSTLSLVLLCDVSIIVS